LDAETMRASASARRIAASLQGGRQILTEHAGGERHDLFRIAGFEDGIRPRLHRGAAEKRRIAGGPAMRIFTH
jgi:hypothetical protein